MGRFAALLILLPLFLAALVSPLAAAQIVQSGRRYISDDEFAARYRMRARDFGTQVEVYDASRKLTLYPDKRYCLYNGVRYSLSFAPLRKGRLHVSQIDQLSLFDSLLGSRSVPWHKIGVIVLDPGHGGRDQGGAGTIYKEKNLTLQLAKKVQALLQRAGYRVLLTRSGDGNMTLLQRTNFANAAKADLFISIHSNAAANKTVSGIETFVLTPQGAPSDSSSKAAAEQYAGNVHNNNSVALGNHIHRQLIARTKANDRGLKRARFQVLRDARCPSVLLEVGFLSNPAEERKLGADAYQSELARGIAAGIMTYHKELIRNRQLGRTK